MPLHLTDKADFNLYFELEKQRCEKQKKEFPFTRELFIAATAEIPSIGFAQDGVPFGCAVFYNHEIHFSFLESFHGRWSSLIRPMWEWMFSFEDPVRARVEKENQTCIDFMRRQWPVDGEDHEYVFFKLSKANMHDAFKPRHQRKAYLRKKELTDISAA